MKKRIAGIILFTLVFAAACFITPGEKMPDDIFKALAVLVLAIILWVAEPVPTGAAAVLIMVLPLLLGIRSFKDTIQPFANSTVFFVIATFGLSAAISKLPLAKRILLFLLNIFGSSIEKIIFAIMAATAFISSVMSNIPAALMFMGVSLNLLELYDSDEDKRRTGRAVMIALPAASMIGGTMTPAGSSNNILALDLLEANSGVIVTFLDWMIVCIPVVIVMLPAAWFLIIKIYSPAPIDKEKLDSFIAELKILPKPQKQEYLLIAISAAMILFWILGSFFPFIDTTVVAIIGLIAMFLPGVDLFTWKEFENEVSWSAILMVGSVLCIGSLIRDTGAASWFASIFFRFDADGSLFALILKLAVFMYIMQVILPNGPAAITTTVVPVIAAASAAGLNPAVLVIPLTIFCSWAMILPLNPVPMLTYSSGYYKITDISKAGIPLLAILMFVLALWIPFISGILFQ